MSVELADSHRTQLDADEAQTLASAIIARTDPAESFDAAAVLAEHPGLAKYRSVVVDLAYEEFCRRIEAGEPADPQAFARRFPAVASSLRKVLEVHQYIQKHPEAFASPAAPVWPEAGEDVPGFTLVREIGRGGFSRVFLARERDLGDREVVLKLCVQANEEAARLGRLEHPHIVPIHSVRSDALPGLTGICMPYLGSATLADVLAIVFAAGSAGRRGADILKAVERVNQRCGAAARELRSAPARVHWTLRRGSYAEAILETGAQLCEALAYAHRQGICHCDVKPSNVLLTAAGEALLLDFNLSMQQGGAAAVMGGTLPYMAPEQLRFVLARNPASLPEIDSRADLFALGVTLFQLLTGGLPFDVDTPPDARKETARRLLEQQQARSDLRGELERTVSPAAADVIAACLAFDRDDRPASAEQVAERLRGELRAGPRIRRWLHAHRRAAAAAALMSVLAAAALGIGLASRSPFHLRQFEQGIVYLDDDDFSAARECFARAVEADRAFVQAWLLQGWAELKAAQAAQLDPAERKRRLDSARDIFWASWRQTECAESAASLACYHVQKNTFDEAAGYYREAIDRGFRTPAAHNNLGQLLWQKKDLREAALQLEDAVRLNPQFQAAHHTLANLEWLLAEKELGEAVGARARKEEESRAAHEARAVEYLLSAADHIEAARQYGDGSADLELAAARIYAWASEQFRGQSNPAAGDPQEDFSEKAWAACQAAVYRYHLPPKKLAILEPKMGHDPRFQQLLKARPSRAAERPAPLLVDLYPDIRERLIGSHREARGAGDRLGKR